MIDPIERIHAECELAIHEREGWNKEFASGDAAPFSKMELSALNAAKRGFRKRLRAFQNAHRSGNKQRIQNARRRLCKSRDARLMAIVRATRNHHRHIPYDELLDLAGKLNLNTAFKEPLIIQAMQSKPGSWRPIAKSGKYRAAQQFIIRDILLIQLGENDVDSTVKGAGGEKQTFVDLQKAVEEGYLYWVSLDVKNFFPSLRQGHLKAFPFSKWVLGNLVFLPSDTPIKFVNKSPSFECSEHDILNDEGDLPSGCSFSKDDLKAKLKTVRQGLLQGDVCAPQIARTFLGRELQHVLEKRDTAYGSHLDDLILGARSLEALKASLNALRSHLKLHPAGPLELHDHKIVHIKDGVEFLGYRAKLTKKGEVHVTPSPKRFKRFRERLIERWEGCDAFTKVGLRKIGVEYAENWFKSQSAWTHKGPPGFSDPKDSYSWGYLLTEIEQLLNQFIKGELDSDIGGWHETDLDFDYID